MDVGLRQRKTGIQEKRLEALFEFASDEVDSALRFLNDGSEGGDPGLPGVSLDQVAEPERVREPELLGLPHCAAELVALNDSTEVEERVGHGRGWDAEVRGGLVGGEVGPEEVDAGARAPSPWHLTSTQLLRRMPHAPTIA